MWYLSALVCGCVVGASLLFACPAVAQVAPAAIPSTATTRFQAWLTSPRKAGILSAVVPGAGQVYNRQFWKVPVVFATLGGATYQEVQYWRRYQEYKRGYEARKQFANGNKNAVDTGPRSSREPSDQAQKAQFYAYRTRRDQWLGITAGVYALQILDAITAAHLRDFDVSESIALEMHPTLLAVIPTTPVLGLQLNMTLRSPATEQSVSLP